MTLEQDTHPWGYLTQIALDIIKIDKSFAHNSTRDPNRIAVVRGMVAIANALEVPIIIEGVETKDQYTFFSDLKCQTIQGFYFSPPVPASEIPHYSAKVLTLISRIARNKAFWLKCKKCAGDSHPVGC